VPDVTLKCSENVYIKSTGEINSFSPCPFYEDNGIKLLKIRGCALCGPLLSGDVIPRVLRELELP